MPDRRLVFLSILAVVLAAAGSLSARNADEPPMIPVGGSRKDRIRAEEHPAVSRLPHTDPSLERVSAHGVLLCYAQPLVWGAS